MQLARSAANAILEVDDFMHRKILHESIVAHDLLEPIAVSEARHALEISLLHAAIGMRYFGEAMPKVTLIESAQGVELDHDVGDHVTDFIVLDERFSPDMVLLTVLHYAFHHRIDADSAVATVFKLHVGIGDFPAVVFAADQILRRHAHVIEEDGILDSHH